MFVDSDDATTQNGLSTTESGEPGADIMSMNNNAASPILEGESNSSTALIAGLAVVFCCLCLLLLLLLLFLKRRRKNVEEADEDKATELQDEADLTIGPDSPGYETQGSLSPQSAAEDYT